MEKNEIKDEILNLLKVPENILTLFQQRYFAL
jgi:hypothetical protein